MFRDAAQTDVGELTAWHGQSPIKSYSHRSRSCSPEGHRTILVGSKVITARDASSQHQGNRETFDGQPSRKPPDVQPR